MYGCSGVASLAQRRFGRFKCALVQGRPRTKAPRNLDFPARGPNVAHTAQAVVRMALVSGKRRASQITPRPKKGRRTPQSPHNAGPAGPLLNHETALTTFPPRHYLRVATSRATSCAAPSSSRNTLCWGLLRCRGPLSHATAGLAGEAGPHRQRGTRARTCSPCFKPAPCTPHQLCGQPSGTAFLLHLAVSTRSRLEIQVEPHRQTHGETVIKILTVTPMQRPGSRSFVWVLSLGRPDLAMSVRGDIRY